MEYGIKQLIVKLLFILTHREKKQIIILAISMILMGFMEVMGIVSVLPLISLISDPDTIKGNKYIAPMLEEFNIDETKSMILYAAFFSISVLVINNIVKLMVNRYIYIYSWRLNHNLSMRLTQSYLSKKYKFFVERSTTGLTKNILTETYQVTSGVFVPFIHLISRSIIVIFIITMLIIVDPITATLITFIFGGGYVLIYIFLKNKISIQGILRTESHERRMKAIIEVLRGIKEIKLLGKEEVFKKKFEVPSKQYSSATSSHQILQIVPGYIMEVFAMGGLILVIIVVLLTTGQTKNIIPLVTLYAFAGYRLTPSFQTIFNSLSTIRFNAKPLSILHNDLQGYQENKNTSNDDYLEFKKSIKLTNISISYEGKSILNKLNLTIEFGKSIGITGVTGSGKTTLIDIILGLLIPDSGEIYIDGTLLTENNTKAWQKNISYVPQSIYLIDDTIASNIAFGETVIDFKKVEWALKQAALTKMVSDLPSGYNTIVGEDGVKLSGGQKQRIGIARALYQKPTLLILDEATSALDEKTERQVINSIYMYSKKCTVIMIAHRLSTLENADSLLDLGTINNV